MDRNILRGTTLYRFIKSQIGRPWDKVYHEICSQFDSRSNIGSEVRRRLKWIVEQDCFKGEDGIAYHKDGEYPVRGLYLDDSGIIREQTVDYSSRFQPKPWEREINYISFKDGMWYEKDDNGDWYFYWYETVKDTYPVPSVDENGNKITIVKETESRLRHKKELNHKEVQYLKKHLFSSGTNKDMLVRLNGRYIPASDWKKA
jgi:hypothetical protein